MKRPDEMYAERAENVLSRYVVGFASGVEGRSQFENMPAETIIKELVRFNATSEATKDNGRVRDADTRQTVVIESDQGRGQIMTVNFGWRNLRDAIEAVCDLDESWYALVEMQDGVLEFRYLPKGHKP
jgi:hypothetical protein